MIKRRIRLQYLIILVGVLFVLPLLTIATLVKTNLNDEIISEPDYIEEGIIERSLPVINPVAKIINPYLDSNVKVGKTYYDYKANEESQLNSILQHDNTYIQNTGIDFVNETPFEIVAIYSGKITSVKEDELLGKVVEMEQDNGDVSIYQSLSEVRVKKGDIVSQGQVLGTSGNNKMDQALGNHLHLEIYKNGQPINPENYLNKEIKTEKEQ